jgi:hypothetical protein
MNQVQSFQMPVKMALPRVALRVIKRSFVALALHALAIVPTKALKASFGATYTAQIITTVASAVNNG